MMIRTSQTSPPSEGLGEAKLYLIPTPLGECELDSILPAFNTEIISTLKYFIVENVRTARRFIKKAVPASNIDALIFFELNQHTDPVTIGEFLKPMKDGYDMGILSEAGCPAIADPGMDVVALAQQNGYDLVPLVGPSSILLSLMASGFNGQNFAFVGYLPIQQNERTKRIKQLEARAYAESQSQLFIETPYRNMKLLEELLNTCQPKTRLCIAADITLETQFIKTKMISEWKKSLPKLDKRPCIFLIYK